MWNVYLCNFLNENIIWVENYGQKCKFKMAEFWLGMVIPVKLKMPLLEKSKE